MFVLTRRASLGAVAAVAAAALARPRPARAATEAADIDNFTFSPAMMTVAPGTKVTWTNHDDIPHTVTSSADTPVFNSPPLDTGDAFSFTFDSPGTFGYFCALHPHMQGTVVVR